MVVYFWLVFFFFKQKTAYEMRISDWSSDVCSSDLSAGGNGFRNALACRQRCIDVGSAFEHDRIDGDAVTGPKEAGHARLDPRRRQTGSPAVGGENGCPMSSQAAKTVVRRSQLLSHPLGGDSDHPEDDEQGNNRDETGEGAA